MSRVNHRNKHMNTPKGDERCNPGPVVIVQPAHGDYTKARTFPTWRKLKYGMSTKAFSRKSPARKAALRAEYHEDTGYIAPTHPVPPNWDEDELDTSDVDTIFQSIQKRNQELYNHFEEVRKEVQDKKQQEYAKIRSMDEWLYKKHGITRKSWKRKSHSRKEALRAEYTRDTGRIAPTPEHPIPWDDFLESKFLTQEKFDQLTQWKQDTYREQYENACRNEIIMRSRRPMTDREAEEYNAQCILIDCGVPMGPDGEFCGI